MKRVGIYRKAYPAVSESFIREQADNMRRYQPTFVLCTQTGEIPFQSVSLSQGDRLGMRQMLYLLTRSPRLFTLDRLAGLNLLHAHFGPDGVYAMALARRLKIPFLVTFHGYDITVSRRAAWRSGMPLYYQLILHERELQQKAAGFIAVSDFIYKKLLERGYPEEKIIRHYIGVDSEKFSPRRDATAHRYILCVGRHTQKKGIDTLLRAFAQIAKRHPDVELVQVGTGSMSAELRTLAMELGIHERVRFLGAQPHQVVLGLMQGAEVFALPSQTAANGDSEGLPIVFNEASACCVPIVSTWHSGIPEAVLDGKTGFLVPEKDHAALADRLDILLADPALGSRMGARGRELVCEEFDIRKQTAKLEAIYDSFTPNPG